MLFTSLALLMVAAALHALTNTLMKKSRDKLAFGWWQLGLFCVGASPILLFSKHVPAIGWTFVILSGTLEALYYYSLSQAYTHGELSVVYPIARGSAPVFVLIWASLFLNERPTSIGLLGIFLVVTGLYLIHLPRIQEWMRPLAGFRTSALRWALLTGLLISFYTAVDKKGIVYFSPWLYLYLILFVCWIFLGLQWFISERRAALLAEVSLDRSLFPVLGAAVFGTCGYAFVLTAMRLTPVSYVSPVREISVVMGTWIGVRFLGEAGGTLRVVAACIVAAGVLLIAVAG
jgi:drug/metabolite transporter (DMT)-like permease